MKVNFYALEEQVTSIQRMPNLGRPHQYGRKLGRRYLFGDMIYSRFSRYKYIHTDRFDIRHGPSRVACTNVCKI